MAKLFISYAREDIPIVEALGQALSSDGHEVWWDRELATAAGAFRLQIQEALDAADLVLVAWTARSRASRFVADEAEIALSQGKLLSLLIDDARPALGFGAIHGVNLVNWTHSNDDEALVALRREINRRLASGPQSMPERPAARVLGAAVGLCAATAIGIGVAQAAGLAAIRSAAAAMHFGLEHAAYALALSVPVAAYAAARSRSLGRGGLRVLSRTYVRTLAIGFILALTLGILALANGVDADLPRAERVQSLLSTVLFATLVAAAIVGGLQLLMLIMQRKRS